MNALREQGGLLDLSTESSPVPNSHGHNGGAVAEASKTSIVIIIIMCVRKGVPERWDCCDTNGPPL